MLSVTSLVPRFLAFYVLTIVYRKLKTVIDILKKHERQPFPIYRRERKKLKPIQKRPIFTMLVLVSTLGFFFSFLFLLWYKEHHRIINIEPLQVALSKVIPVTDAYITDRHIGSPVHFTGKLVAENDPQDTRFKFRTQGLALHRIVEMYQFVASDQSTDMLQKYQWIEGKVIHKNVIQAQTVHSVGNDFFTQVKSETFFGKLRIGQFNVHYNQVKHLINFQPVDIDPIHLKELPPRLSKEAKVYKDKFYFSKDPVHPQPGEVLY